MECKNYTYFDALSLIFGNRWLFIKIDIKLRYININAKKFTDLFSQLSWTELETIWKLKEKSKIHHYCSSRDGYS